MRDELESTPSSLTGKLILIYIDIAWIHTDDVLRLPRLTNKCRIF